MFKISNARVLGGGGFSGSKASVLLYRSLTSVKTAESFNVHTAHISTSVGMLLTFNAEGCCFQHGIPAHRCVKGEASVGGGSCSRHFSSDSHWSVRHLSSYIMPSSMLLTGRWDQADGEWLHNGGSICPSRKQERGLTAARTASQGRCFVKNGRKGEKCILHIFEVTCLFLFFFCFFFTNDKTTNYPRICMELRFSTSPP